jgi:nucleoside-diphosphate-sugar epimerase
VRIAIGGGRGFVGGAIARALAAARHDVIAFGREGAPGGHADALVWAGGRREADLDANRAAHVSAPLTAALALAPRVLVYLSSAEIYGGSPVPFREDGPIDPRTPYAIAKREGEETLAALAPSVFVVRPGVVYGPGQPPRMLIPRVLAAVRAGETIALTDGAQTRDFLHVDDLAELIVCLVCDDPSPGTYNAGTGVETSVRDAATLLARAIDPARVGLLDFGKAPARPDEQSRYVLDVARAATRCCWQARIALADGLARLAAP